MSTLYIAEFSGVGESPQQTMQAAIAPALAVQAIAFTGTAGVSAVFGPSTKLVRIATDATASFRFSTDGSLATTGYPRIAAGVPEYFNVQPGMFVSAIANS